IQLILEDHVGQNAGVGLDDMDFGFRGLVEKLRKRRRKYRSCKSRHKADTDRSENAIGPDSLLCGVEPLQHVDALAVVYSPGGRQSNVTSVAFEKRSAEFRLELLDVLRNAGLGRALASGSCRKRCFLADCYE